MQKIIIIAILAAVAFSAAVNVDNQVDGTKPATGTLDGYIVSMGVIQKCHRMCKTCTQPDDATKCASCQTGFSLDATAKTCGCTTTTDVLSSSADDVVACKATSATAAECKKISAYANSDTKVACVLCPNKFNECTDATTIVDKATGCWAGMTGASTTACGYDASNSFVATLVTKYDSAATTINGYYHDATTFEYKPCNAGCLTCTATEKCSTCATGFTAVGTAKTACECAAGSYTSAATASAVDTCTKCPTGCTTCTSGTVCTACDSSTHVMGTSTTDSSTCLSLSSTDTSATASTTDGEKDGESTSATATDATSTNGVLLTAASMLLAVILA